MLPSGSSYRAGCLSKDWVFDRVQRVADNDMTEVRKLEMEAKKGEAGGTEFSSGAMNT